MIRKSISAGIAISLGCIVSQAVGGSVLGAVLFSIGLLTVFHLKLNLFTGKVCTDTLPSDLLAILFFNLCAAIIMGVLFPGGDVSTKLAESVPQILLKGFMCNVLIGVAVKAKNDLITVLAVVVFILSGYEHCIANAFYLSASRQLFTVHGSGFLIINIFANILGGVCFKTMIKEKDNERD